MVEWLFSATCLYNCAMRRRQLNYCSSVTAQSASCFRDRVIAWARCLAKFNRSWVVDRINRTAARSIFAAAPRSVREPPYLYSRVEDRG
jgi:hypothetical protein